MTIPASAIVQINPGVINGGGAALNLNGVMLTTDTAVPIGAVMPFADPDAVGEFFGLSSLEADLAKIYFNGYDNSTKKPGNLFFSQYAEDPVAAYVRGGSVAAMTLDQLKALSGTLIVTIDGTVETSAAINLSTATSFSNAATIIEAGFTSFTGAVSYDAIRKAFVITSETTGAESTISFVSGTLAAALMLTQATGAVTSQGSDAMTPETAMAAIKSATLNWASFMTTFEPEIADKLAFSAWTNGENERFVYVGYDSDVTATQSGNTTSWGAQLKASGSSGSVPIHGDATHAAFVLGAIASIDFERTNGRITFKFKSQDGLIPSVTDETVANILTANGYNFYGAYATANQGFQFYAEGIVSGEYSFLDEYVNQIWLNNALQLAMVELLVGIPSIPYNSQGYALIDAACMDPITAAVNFGAIRANVPLSASQAAQVNNAAGVAIDKILSSRGWYLQILPATAQVRAARGTPPMTFWYMDGGSVHSIVLASIVIQ